MCGVLIDTKVFIHLLSEKFSDLYNHIAVLDLDLSVIMTRWFVCLLVLEVTKETSMLIWDLFLLKGPKVIFRVMLAIFQMMSKSILKIHDHGELWMYLKNYPENELDVTLLVALIDNPKLHISNSEINELRGFAYKDVQDEL